MEEIKSFRGKYSFLSNFYKHTLNYMGQRFLTAEHAYQWSKTIDRKERNRVRMSMTPGIAKTRGGGVTLREDWEDIKLDVMKAIVFNKFSQCPTLIRQLLNTEGIHLIEGNKWHDNYWGECYCNDSKCILEAGRNHLGNILVQTRHALSFGDREKGNYACPHLW